MEVALSHLGPICDYFGANLGALWGHFWVMKVALGSFGVDLGLFNRSAHSAGPGNWKLEDGRWKRKRQAGRGKREEGRGKREEGRGKRVKEVPGGTNEIPRRHRGGTLHLHGF